MPPDTPNRIDKTVAPRCLMTRAGAYAGLWLLLGAALSASDWHGPEVELAGKIAALTSPQACKLEFENRSSLPAAEADEIHRQLVFNLRGRGFPDLGAQGAGVRIKVTLSEDPRHYLWLAEVQDGAESLAIALVSRARVPSHTSGAAALTIEQTPLWSQQLPILDIALFDGNPGRMVVLDPDHLTFYTRAGTDWQATQVLAIPHSHPWPRDLRGRLRSSDEGSISAYLPGLLCQASREAAPGLSCRETAEPWPLDFAPPSERPAGPSAFFSPLGNFFTGRLSPGVGKQDLVPPFYSAAPIPRSDTTVWLLSATDGRFHLLDGVLDQILPSPGRASDVASVNSGCGSGWQVLATGTAQGPGDSVQAYEVSGQQLLALGRPTEFSDGVTALWTESGNRVIAVTHSFGTRSYEAFQLDIACRR